MDEAHYFEEVFFSQRLREKKILFMSLLLTPVGEITNSLSALISLKMAERSVAKSAKRSFASKYLNF
jgi:hypothetical protein